MRLMVSKKLCYVKTNHMSIINIIINSSYIMYKYNICRYVAILEYNIVVGGGNHIIFNTNANAIMLLFECLNEGIRQ